MLVIFVFLIQKQKSLSVQLASFAKRVYDLSRVISGYYLEHYLMGVSIELGLGLSRLTPT